MGFMFLRLSKGNDMQCPPMSSLKCLVFLICSAENCSKAHKKKGKKKEEEEEEEEKR